ncbi:hypothetical protein [Methylobacterium sp. WL9]|uniref:hypothetical protein n=1 Tax=Methylobacterium sp. WL9 TaxID=2603898 RepID=UPI0016505468|nr:hypothetical protein [Methylobacterium sp. WL9]
MDAIRHPSFVWVLTWIGTVLMVVGFAATEPEDRVSFRVLGSITLLTVAALVFLARGQ